MKLYKTESIALKIVAGLVAQGKVATAVAQNGKWAVMVDDTPPAVSEETQTPDFTAPTEVGEAPKTATMFIPGAKITKMYVITPAIGDSKVGPRPRWFEKKRLISAEYVEGGVQITASLHAFSSRKIDLSGLAATEVNPEVVAEAAAS